MSNLATCYLFFGGSGAGALVVLCILELVQRRADEYRHPFERATLTRMPFDFFSVGWVTVAIPLFVGVMCLVFDLGRMDRIDTLFFSPHATFLSYGSYAIGGALLIVATFVALSFFDISFDDFVLRKVLAALGLIAGISLVIYTGFLLQSLPSVAMWHTPLLPMLFLVTSISAGFAWLLLSAVFNTCRADLATALYKLVRFDGALLVVEALLLVLYLTWGYANESSRVGAMAVLTGDMSVAFWGALVIMGLAAPLLASRFLTYSSLRTQLMFVAGCVLAGCFVLRFLVVGFAQYDIAGTLGSGSGGLPAETFAEIVGGEGTQDVDVLIDDDSIHWE